ncbi:snapalysin family zinc-dependent metalloprotease [Nonomuraea sp. NN258]|uniref:snapalysin family zinc-dependent metalloprotease n=1 Tax=Nonomuraea antri TaxID=2730852 RepID=UPI001569F3F5|nr:snapalysin family zinc-dependent metalloprotease [Nonomuraea antri]NRQ37628.1 snapalysin family zinc-dependent metalloprotease [Nonomuraea antri]
MSRALRLAISLALTFTFLLISSPAQAVSMVRVLRYDASRAAEFRGAVDQAAQIWNSSVVNVRLVPGTPAHFVVYADNGWPRALPTGLGRGTVWIGRQATAQGHNALRISTHEIGHILGLPDRRTGRCSDLMSGASAGVSCTNPYPNAAERAEVDRNFAGGAPAVKFGELLVDR